MLAVLPLSLLCAVVLGWAVRGWLRRCAILDTPNGRSLHQIPVPRGGGLAVLATLFLGVGMAVSLDLFVWSGRFGWVVAGLCLLGGVCWLDDRKGLGVLPRLGAQCAAALMGVAALPPDLLFGGMVPWIVERALFFLGWVWFMNLYNFMDGIDGITGAQTVGIVLGIVAVLFGAGAQETSGFLLFLSLLIAGAALGFLVFNWHPASLFLGDVGSVPLGFLLGYALLLLALQHHQPVAALILPLYYLADSGLTLAQRLVRGERVWQAHREHFYQKAAKAVGRHDKVVLVIALGHLYLVGMAALATRFPVAAAPGAVLGVTLLLLKLRSMAKSPTAPS